MFLGYQRGSWPALYQSPTHYVYAYSYAYTALKPPSTVRATPVTLLEASEARNRTTRATSTGSPYCPLGITAANRSRAACGFAESTISSMERIMRVLVAPGHTALTR